MQASFVIDLGNKSQIPIISFSATSPDLNSIRSPYFFQATVNDSSQVKAISAIIQAFGWRQVVPIHVDNVFGKGIIPYLYEALEEVDARIPYRSIISPRATNQEIEIELYKVMTMQTRVFIVHMGPDLGSRIFRIAKEIGMMGEGYVWIITDGMTNLWSVIDRSDVDYMQGVLGLRNYVPNSKELKRFEKQWKLKFLQDNPGMGNAKFDIFGLWAYDATTTLAMAVEEVFGTTNFNFDAANVSQNGPTLIQALSRMRLKGLSGDFGFINGQLESPIFQIVNFNGNGENGIGFWTPNHGLVRRLEVTNVTRYSTSKGNLGSIIWPGDPQSIPKGWEIPINGKRLKIGVPMQNGFTELVKIALDNSTNSTTFSGYCIDVFNAVMNVMPYHVPFDFYPIKLGEEETYNNLIDEVVYGNYDAVVGDISIIANRSKYVEYTLPFVQSGVEILVPIRNDVDKNAWVFLKPLSWDLWITSICFFTFLAFVIWVLEHRINEEFRGPPLHHVGTSFWFSFSTIVFAHREKVLSNPARIVVVIWCVVVFILTQSYTASLTSLLTVQQLQPTVTDVNELLMKGENIGYQIGSFVREIVLGLKFHPSQIKTYYSPQHLEELFTKGSANGGIAAAIDEIPCLNVFLAQHCNRYTTLKAPTFRSGGFGFVFPKGSPLAADVSRAILEFIQSDRAEEIENPLKRQPICSTTSGSTNNLSLGSFWGLFLIVGVAGVLALLCYAIEFLYGQKDVWCKCDTGISMWKRILQVLRNFDQRDLTSQAFRQRELKEEGSIEVIRVRGDVETPVNAPIETLDEEPNDIRTATESREIDIHHANTNSS
ncbi:hypothetical protein SLEP1_g12220 [Rubroshorea leprosula]|uniref:Glutamate receptor n=1 Tax=Rubroshorea leprosula TaxID=152421 RepID=A0AAV5IHI0_9ROSI|nr:hypothetical protein SLEP1_g12220 [Rubroshorea leprosula]